MKTPERGPKGDHGQHGEQGLKGDKGNTGAAGKSFSRTQVLVLFAFVVVAFLVVAARTEHNSHRLDRMQQQIDCMKPTTLCK